MNRHMAFRILVLAATLVLPAAGQTEDEIIDALNDRYAGTMWPQVREFLTSQAVHGAAESTARAGLTLRRREVEVDLRRAPAFSRHPDGAVLRLPGAGDFRIHAPVAFKGYDVDAEIDLSVRIDLRPTTALVTPSVDVEIDDGLFLGEILDIFGGWSQDARNDIRRTIGRFAPRFFGPSIWDAGPASELPPGELELLRGDPDLPDASAIDIVFVADGWVADRLGAFDEAVEVLAGRLLAPDVDSEPFRSFSRSIRLWRWRHPTVDASEASPERAVGFERVRDERGTVVSGFSAPHNHARFGRLLLADDRPDLFVLLVDQNRLPRDLARAALRPTAHGNVVFFPISGSGLDADGDGHDDGLQERGLVLVHELGHTFLGGLADEYVEAGFEDTAFLGLEPNIPNVTRHGGSFPKWSHWADHMADLDPAVHGDFDPRRPVEGAFFFGFDVFRPMERCRMNGDGPFCPICREALTEGMLDHLDRSSIRYEVEYLEPLPKDAIRAMVADGETVSLGAFRETDQTVRLAVASAPIPTGWRLEWTHRRGEEVLEIAEDTAPERTFTISLGDTIDLVLASDCSFAPRRELPTYRVRFAFDRRILLPPLLPPDRLWQSVPIGAEVDVTYDRLGFASSILAVGARATGFGDASLPTRLEFRFEGPTEVRWTTGPLGPGDHHLEPVFLATFLPPGAYLWSVRSVFGSSRSDWSHLPAIRSTYDGDGNFQPGDPTDARRAYDAYQAGGPVPDQGGAPRAPAIDRDGDSDQRAGQVVDYHVILLRPGYSAVRQAPADPTDLAVDDEGGNRVVLRATSASANGRSIRLEFEVRPAGVPFTGQPTHTSGNYPAPAAGLSSIRVEGAIDHPAWGYYHWQVRARDDGGLASKGWTTGPAFGREPVKVLLPGD